MSLSNKLFLPLGILLFGIGAIILIFISKPTPTPSQDLLAPAAKINVRVKMLQRESVTLSAISQGTVNPKREIDLVAQVAGQIVRSEKQFEQGEFFDQGALLVEIDPRDYHAALLSAQARLAQAKRVLAEEEGQARQAEKEWRELGSKKANDLFLRKPQLLEAQTDLKSAEADLEVAQLNLERTKIRVPFAGRVRETYVDLGQFVAIGTPLAKVYDIGAAEIRLPLTDRELAVLDLPLGTTEVSNRPEVKLTANIGGRPYQWQGVITRTDAAVDASSRMYYAIAEVENPFRVIEDRDGYLAAPLIPGLFVSATISGRQLKDVVVLPRNTLIRRNNIYTLDDDASVQLTPVTVLKKQGDTVWVRTNVDDGTPIVYEKHGLVSPGTIVEPVVELQASSDEPVTTEAVGDDA